MTILAGLTWGRGLAGATGLPAATTVGGSLDSALSRKRPTATRVVHFARRTLARSAARAPAHAGTVRAGRGVGLRGSHAPSGSSSCPADPRRRGHPGPARETPSEHDGAEWYASSRTCAE